MDRGEGQTAEQAARCPSALRPSALVLTTTQRLNLPKFTFLSLNTASSGVLEILLGPRWEQTAVVYQTYWQIGPAFPPVSERRDHPGPPIRELTTDFGPGTNKHKET